MKAAIIGQTRALARSRLPVIANVKFVACGPGTKGFLFVGGFHHLREFLHLPSGRLNCTPVFVIKHDLQIKPVPSAVRVLK